MLGINLNESGRNMESKNKILFAYPVALKEDMTKEEMCIPSPFFSSFEKDTTNSFGITVGYSVLFGPKTYILINYYKLGESEEVTDISDNGHVENLRVSIYKNHMGIFLSCFHMHDFEVKNSGYYEIKVQLIIADEEGNPTSEVLDELRTQFFVQVRDKK